MTVYNILFPFLILVALGVVVFILVRHLGEVPTLSDEHVKEEKKRWWQILLGKGEGLLKVLRAFVLRIDDKLKDSIKNVREKKNNIEMSLGDRVEERQPESRNVSEENNNSSENFSADSLSESTESQEKSENISEPNNQNTANPPTVISTDEVKKTAKELNFENKRPETEPKPKIAERIRKPLKFRFSFHKDKIPVQEIVKKTFTADEIQNEKKEYWKKKEAMLIQSIVREPKNVNLFLQLGRLYCNQKNWDDAKNAFYEVLKLDRMNIKAKEELKRIEKNENKD